MIIVLNWPLNFEAPTGICHPRSPHTAAVAVAVKLYLILTHFNAIVTATDTATATVCVWIFKVTCPKSSLLVGHSIDLGLELSQIPTTSQLYW